MGTPRRCPRHAWGWPVAAPWVAVLHACVCVLSAGWSVAMTMMDVVHTLLPGGDTWTLPVPRLLVERFSGRFWAWLDREEFLVPKNVLDIVAGQTVTWMGLFYCPLLPLLNSVFIFLTFYIKKVRAHWLRGSRVHLGGHLEWGSRPACPPVSLPWA